MDKSVKSFISGFRRDVDEICLLMGYNAALRGNSLQTFRDKTSVPSSRVKRLEDKNKPTKCTN